MPRAAGWAVWCCLGICLAILWGPRPIGAFAQQTAADSNEAASVPRASPVAIAHSQSSLNAAWQAVGPAQIASQSYGNVTGRVTSVAIDPADASGNTVYLGTTGGGVWKSTNAAGAAASVSFRAADRHASRLQRERGNGGDSVAEHRRGQRKYRERDRHSAGRNGRPQRRVGLVLRRRDSALGRWRQRHGRWRSSRTDWRSCESFLCRPWRRRICVEQLDARSGGRGPLAVGGGHAGQCAGHDLQRDGPLLLAPMRALPGRWGPSRTAQASMCSEPRRQSIRATPRPPWFGTQCARCSTRRCAITATTSRPTASSGRA